MKRFLLLLLLLPIVACANTVQAPPTVTPVAPASPTAVPSVAPTPVPTRVPPTPTLLPTVTPPPTATALPPTAPPSPTAGVQPLAPIGGLSANTSAAWQEFVATVNAQDGATQQATVDAFFNAVKAARREPLILDDNVLFLYQGDAQSVQWLGDFSFWTVSGAVAGQRLGSTNLWYGLKNLPRDSRVDYGIFLNKSQNQTADPANPRARESGSGVNNYLVMPAFQVSDESKRRDGVPQGTLTDWITYNSNAYGAPLNYSVYTPPGYGQLQNLPVIYVTDGDRFSNERIGALQVAIDNLIAEQKIEPVMAVFIDARDPNPPHADNRNQELLFAPIEFGKFIVNELIPTIDAQYHTAASPAGRAIFGASFGGTFATYMAMQYPDTFGKLVALSPAYWVLGGSGAAPQGAEAKRMNDVIQQAFRCPAQTTVPCPTPPLEIFMSSGASGWDVGDLLPQVKPLQARGDRVTLMRVQEGHNWDAWAGELDEVLEYFWSKSPQP